MSDNRVFLIIALLMLVGAAGAALGGALPLAIALAVVAAAMAVVGLQKKSANPE